MKSAMLRKTRHLFPDELWSPLAIVAMPEFVFDEHQTPVLTKSELGTYALVCRSAEERRNNCSVDLSISDLQLLMGFAKRSDAIKARDGLENKKFIRRVVRKGNKAQRYVLVNPKTLEDFAIETGDKRQFQSFRSRLRHSGIGYFNVPAFAIEHIRQVSSSSFAAFIGAARYMNLLQERDAEINAAVLCSMSGLSRKTLNKSIAALNKRWLTIGFTDTSYRTVFVELINNSTRETLMEFARKQKELDEEERQKRMREQRTNSSAQLLAFAMWCIGDHNAKHTSGADFMFRCPDCRNGKTHKPKFAVNPFMGTHGCFYCHDCGIGGGLTKLGTQKVGLFDALKKLHAIETTEPLLFQKAQKLLRGYGVGGYSQRAS